MSRRKLQKHRQPLSDFNRSKRTSARRLRMFSQSFVNPPRTMAGRRRSGRMASLSGLTFPPSERTESRLGGGHVPVGYRSFPVFATISGRGWTMSRLGRVRSRSGEPPRPLGKHPSRAGRTPSPGGRGPSRSKPPDQTGDGSSPGRAGSCLSRDGCRPCWGNIRPGRPLHRDDSESVRIVTGE